MLKDAMRALQLAQRPVLIFGAGVELAGTGELARELAKITGIPVAPTWGARAAFPNDSGILCVGGFGTHGTRAANFAVQNADCILSVGSRLDSKATGTPREYFARGADIFMVDIDPYEIAKFGGKLGRSFRGVQADAGLFLRDAVSLVQERWATGTIIEWRKRCVAWMARYPAVPSAYHDELSVNPYVVVDHLSDACRAGDIIITDTGLSLAWMMQAFRFKRGQTFIHALNQTPMGYGLPAAIGAAMACPGRRVVHVTGDGGFMLNIQELPLVAKHGLPIKIVLFNNRGHAMCRQTQEQWLGGKYFSTSVDGGLAMPDFYEVVASFGVGVSPTLTLNEEVRGALGMLFFDEHPRMLEVVVDSGHRLIPQVQYGKPNEDGNPPLPRDELAEQMIVGTVG